MLQFEYSYKEKEVKEPKMKIKKAKWALFEIKVGDTEDSAMLWALNEEDEAKLAENKLGITLNKEFPVVTCTMLIAFNTKKEAKAAWKQKQYFSDSKTIYFIHKVGNKTLDKYYKKWLF